METSDSVIAAIREKSATTMLAFSFGKDSIAAYLALRERFDHVIPYYLYSVPGLSFIDESLDYYQNFFKTEIITLPHPSLYRMLNEFVFQPPERCLVIEQANLPRFDYEDVRLAVIKKAGCDADTYVADGVRQSDSPMRRIAIKKHGAISHAQHKYHAIFDWNKARIVAEFKKHNVKLPVDYKLFGRSFDGIDLSFLLQLKKHRVQDYQRVLEWFPLADLEIFRMECAA